MADNLKSLDGRYFGRDADGFHRAFTGLKAPEIRIGASGSEVSIFGSSAVETASTASNVSAGGLTLLSATAAKSYTMDPPVTGIGKEIVFTDTTTLAQSVTLESGTFRTTDGTTQNKLAFDLVGESVRLVGESTAIFAVVSNVGGVVYSTNT